MQRYYDDGHSISDCMTHFGFTRATFHAAVQRGAVVTRPHGMPLEALLVKGLRRGRFNVKKRLIDAGLLQNGCEQCGLVEWRGKPLSLCLHHVSGDGHDNRLENLQLLCPNCHSQTENFAGRNARRAA